MSFVSETPATFIKVAASSATSVFNYQATWSHTSDSSIPRQSNTIGIGQKVLIELGQDESLGK
jgi:hypothetical protein